MESLELGGEQYEVKGHEASMIILPQIFHRSKYTFCYGFYVSNQGDRRHKLYAVGTVLTVHPINFIFIRDKNSISSTGALWGYDL